MNEQTSRSYNAPRRREKAEATRRAIVQAARELFASQGYQATTLMAIAQEAKVALPTIYAVYGSKAAILSELIKSAGANEDIRELSNEAMTEPEPRRQLKMVAHVIRSIHELDADIGDLLWQAGGGDPDLAAVWRQSHRQQLSRQGEVMDFIAQKGALKSNLTTQMATEIHWALSSPEVYRLLVRERGWSPQRYEDWLADSAAALLLQDP